MKKTEQQQRRGEKARREILLFYVNVLFAELLPGEGGAWLLASASLREAVQANCWQVPASHTPHSHISHCAPGIVSHNP